MLWIHVRIFICDCLIKVNKKENLVLSGRSLTWQTDKLEDSQMELDNSSKSNLQSLVVTAEKLLESKAQMRNRMGEFVPDPRWTTYDAALSQYFLNLYQTFPLLYIRMKILMFRVWSMS